MKYVIDIPDKAIDFMGGRDHVSVFVEPEYKVGDCKHYALRISKEDIEPYTEPDRKAIDLQYARDIENVARMNYNEGAKDAWDFAKAINYMGYDDFVSCFGGKTEEVVYELSYSEVKAKYDAWRKQKDEVRVGDEVETELGNKACVLYGNPDGTRIFVFKADGTTAWWSRCAIHKTGKNHSEVAELLKKMRKSDD